MNTQTYMPQAYTYTITINRFATPSVSGMLTDPNGQQCNMNSSLNAYDEVVFLVSLVNFLGEAALYSASICSAIPITAEGFDQDSAMFRGGQYGPLWTFSAQVNNNGFYFTAPLVCTAQGKWRLTGTFVVEDTLGMYCYALPDPEPTIGNGTN